MPFHRDHWTKSKIDKSVGEYGAVLDGLAAASKPKNGIGSVHGDLPEGQGAGHVAEGSKDISEAPAVAYGFPSPPAALVGHPTTPPGLDALDSTQVADRPSRTEWPKKADQLKKTDGTNAKGKVLIANPVKPLELGDSRHLSRFSSAARHPEIGRERGGLQDRYKSHRSSLIAFVLTAIAIAIVASLTLTPRSSGRPPSHSGHSVTTVSAPQGQSNSQQ